MPSISFFPQRKPSVLSVCRGLAYWAQCKLSSAKTQTFCLKNTGLSYTVPSPSWFSSNLAKYRTYESENSNFILRKYAPEKARIFVDVGANFGWYTMIFSLCAGTAGKVIAIEPEPNNLSLLRTNIATNSLTNVDVVAGGVGAAADHAELSIIDKKNPGRHTMRKGENAFSSVSVSVLPLDDVLSSIDGEIELLKMDIEGYEIDALLGADAVLARTNNLLIEFTPRYLKACGRNPEDLFAILSRHGFVPHVLVEGEAKEVRAQEILRDASEVEKTKIYQIDLWFKK